MQTLRRFRQKEDENRLSKFSRFVRILITLRLIPIKADYEALEASFSICSTKFICHILLAFGPHSVINMVTFYTCKEEMWMLVDNMIKILKEDFITGVSGIVYQYFLFFSFPLSLIILSKVIV